MLTNDFDIAAAVEKMGLTPTSKANGVLRFGSRGSLSVNTSKNTFYDFESEEGGGLLDFVIHKGFAQNHSGAAEWAKQNGIINR